MPIQSIGLSTQQRLGFGWPLIISGYVEYPKDVTSPPAPIITITPISVNAPSLTFNTTVVVPPYFSTDTSNVYFFYLRIKSTESLAAAWHFPNLWYVEEVEHKVTARIPVEPGSDRFLTLTTILSDPPIGPETSGFFIDGPRTITSFPVTFNISGAKPKTRVGLVSWSKGKIAPEETPQGWPVSPDIIISAEEGPITDDKGSAQLTVNKPLVNGPNILQAYYEVQEPVIPGLSAIVPKIFCSRSLQVEVNVPEPPPSRPPPTPSPQPTPTPTPNLSQMLTPLMAIAILGLIPVLIKPKKRAT